ncbi:bifunctional phosphoglucose/phosphomannose isomerase [Thermocrinis minervae]|uniref:Bifunctional phosphoglucose/phosphomannose isomerase n=1 Tax=Thermocrinis minervae TaxID=381751 RepID=A0A1M6S5E7_9AQUI|nr:bifunctional phosphoglucose/phosphomannose isomerase [Thermocrinis minervae]SHK39727.1 bifunctional phosphoglucose/phosphomannose isomerase [Thermocrinis minervae]
MTEALSLLEEFPKQFLVDLPHRISLEKIKGVIFSGMGGSGIVGDFVKLLLERDLNLPMLSLRGYDLPRFVGEDWLVVCTSYSGNTEETISVFEQALERRCRLVAISSGGKLKELALMHGVLHISLPEGFPPRYAFGYMLSSLLSLFGISMKDVSEHLEDSKENIKKEADYIAKRLYGYVPIIYATPLTEPVAFRWKTQINENSKSLCYYVTLPEMHHNEVVGLDNPKTRNCLVFLIMHDEEDHERIKKRVDITQNILKELGIAPIILKGEGNTLLKRLMYLLYLGDYTSCLLAQTYGYDPIPVRVIERIKHELAS